VGCGKFLVVCFPSIRIESFLTFAGNFYSIVNDYDKPARIFFAQGCEVSEEAPEGQ
jgi:hypothetical protein